MAWSKFEETFAFVFLVVMLVFVVFVAAKTRGNSKSILRQKAMDCEQALKTGEAKSALGWFNEHKPGPGAPKWRFVYKTFQRQVKRLQKGLRKTPPKAGRKFTFTSPERKAAGEAFRELKSSYTHVNNDMLSREAMDIARTPRYEGEDQKKIIKRVLFAGGRRHLAGLRKSEGIGVRSFKRPLELERAVKNQPEIALDWFRILLHLHAVCQIQRALACGTEVPGWVLRNGVAWREGMNGDHEPGAESLLHVNEDTKEIFVVPLKEKLVFVP
jgi:hypothetical protein